MPQIDVPFYCMRVCYGETAPPNSIHTSGVSDCVAVILVKANSLRLLHIMSGDLNPNEPDGEKFRSKIVDAALAGDTAIVVHGTNAGKRQSRDAFLSQPLIQALIQRIGRNGLEGYIGSDVVVGPGGTVIVDGRGSPPRVY
jgi:hypothetical protein